ncbi:hypothetical protein MXT24_26115 [Klebsiella pneumoniae]|uniref:hypothetical protein n=1 Tax=Klebsiella pneumoniae TaxID=573 RepID=UPI0021193425|nr:hypothetical protein [Klebsiella pneumoniae]MDG0311390.1 hypothetical protein [Klebsiella pneumoniae]
MMCVTHEMNFARDVADTIWFMDQGQILEKAAPDKFFTAPQHPRARRFLNDLLLHLKWSTKTGHRVRVFPVSVF